MRGCISITFERDQETYGRRSDKGPSAESAYAIDFDIRSSTLRFRSGFGSANGIGKYELTLLAQKLLSSLHGGDQLWWQW